MGDIKSPYRHLRLGRPQSTCCAWRAIKRQECQCATRISGENSIKTTAKQLQRSQACGSHDQAMYAVSWLPYSILVVQHVMQDSAPCHKQFAMRCKFIARQSVYSVLERRAHINLCSPHNKKGWYTWAFVETVNRPPENALRLNKWIDMGLTSMLVFLAMNCLCFIRLVNLRVECAHHGFMQPLRLSWVDAVRLNKLVLNNLMIPLTAMTWGNRRDCCKVWQVYVWWSINFALICSHDTRGLNVDHNHAMFRITRLLEGFMESRISSTLLASHAVYLTW